MWTDFFLASFHHVLVFIFVASLAGEVLLLHAPLDAAGYRRLARLDAVYGTSAGLLILVGIGRLFFGLKGWEYYVASHSFWVKMALFLATGLLSIVPTRRFAAWSRVASANTGFAAPEHEVLSTRRILGIEFGLLLLIPIMAAAMARDIG